MRPLKKVEGLTDEQCKKYQYAIRRGYFRNYDRMWRLKSFTNAFLWKHPNKVAVIDRFASVCGHDPMWEDITDINLMMLVDDLNDCMAPKSVQNVMASINALINDYVLSVNIPSKNHDRICSQKGDVSQAVYLTDHEIKAILEYECLTPLEYTVKRAFLIECLVGARWSEAATIDERNYYSENNTIRYYASKPKRDVVVPCHEYIKPYILTPKETLPIRHITLPKYNEQLRKMCRECGIRDKVSLHRRGKDTSGEKWEYVSSHTGRRSFATNLYLKNISLDTISQLMGHSSPMITKHYIMAERPLDNDVLAAFKA